MGTGNRGRGPKSDWSVSDYIIVVAVLFFLAKAEQMLSFLAQAVWNLLFSSWGLPAFYSFSVTRWHSVQVPPDWLGLVWAASLLRPNTGLLLFCLTAACQVLEKKFFSKVTSCFCQLYDNFNEIKMNFGDSLWNLGRVERIDEEFPLLALLFKKPLLAEGRGYRASWERTSQDQAREMAHQ